MMNVKSSKPYGNSSEVHPNMQSPDSDDLSEKSHAKIDIVQSRLAFFSPFKPSAAPVPFLFSREAYEIISLRRVMR